MGNRSRSKTDNWTYMLTQPMYRLIPAMALPTIATTLMNSVYNLADTYFVSTLGTYATSAVGINASIDNIIMIGGSLLSTGAGSYVSRLLGAKREEHGCRVVSTAFFTAFAFGLAVMMFGLMFTQPLVRLLGATDLILEYAMDYAGYVFYAAPFVASTFVLSQCLRSEGNSKLAFIGMVVGAVLNVILDPIFIFTFDLGVKGASAATAISKFVSFAVLMVPFLSKRTVLRIAVRKISYTADVMPEILRMGMPSLFRIGLSTLSAIVLNKIAAGYSESALAAISVSNRIMMFPFAICLGFGLGYLPISGFSFGAKRYDRAKEAFRFASWASVIGASTIAALIFIFSPWLMRQFTEADQQMMAIGNVCLRLQCLATPFHAWCVVVNMLCSSKGKALDTVLMSASRQGIFFFPLLPILLPIWGVWGVSAVQAVADCLAMLLAVPLAVKHMKGLPQMRLSEESGAEEAVGER